MLIHNSRKPSTFSIKAIQGLWKQVTSSPKPTYEEMACIEFRKRYSLEKKSKDDVLDCIIKKQDELLKLYISNLDAYFFIYLPSLASHKKKSHYLKIKKPLKNIITSFRDKLWP